jgi:hypothetical protein
MPAKNDATSRRIAPPIKARNLFIWVNQNGIDRYSVGLSAIGVAGVCSVVSDEMLVEVVTVPFGISASVPGVVLVLAKSAVNAPNEPVVIPT